MSFDVLAPHYTWMEAVLAGGRLQRCRLAWLEALENSERILIVGVGHGHFLRRCAERHPRSRLVAVDASAGMLRQAERRARRAGVEPARLEFVHARLPDWAPRAEEFDAIVTHFFLDCFAPPELERVVAALARGARPRAKWLVADFALPPAGWARRRARAVHALMYGFFRPVTGIPARRWTEPDPQLRAHGFALAGRRPSEWGLLRSDLWQRGKLRM